VTVSLYVYYKLPPDVDPRALVKAMQADLRVRSGVAGRLLRRRDDPATWMEVYEGLDDAAGFETMLDAAVVRHGLMGILGTGGSRHVERFVTA
jgi:hypothetical protein